VSLTVTTWNINSVRLRLRLVARHLKETAPDVLCLQETKCPDDRFPYKAFHKLGYRHIAIAGQKGYHGVAIVSRLPFAETRAMNFCDKQDCRHVAVRLGPDAKHAADITLHNFYVPAGGDVPDPEVNPKFAHKLAFLDELTRWGVNDRPSARPAILVGDLNVAPYENDVWSTKQLSRVVSHTPIERERLERFRAEADFIDAVRALKPEPERVYTWWSYRSPDWATADKGRRLDHVWLSPSLKPHLGGATIDKSARGWRRPSDHVPVTVTLNL
jgi:exodeoxyribonuclease-3